MLVFGFFGKGKGKGKLTLVKPKKSFPIEAVLGKGKTLENAILDWATRYDHGPRKASRSGGFARKDR